MKTGTIVGSYQILKRTKQTNWSRVYAARRVGTPTMYEAIALELSTAPIRRALTEITRADASTSLSFIAKSPTILSHEGRIVLVARDELGETLDVLLTGNVHIPPLLAIALTAKIAHAVDSAPQRPHGDLAPENIVICYGTKGFEVRLGGITLALAMAGGFRGRAVGAVPYMAPERLSDPATADARADVYALGLILYELLTSRRALSAPSDEALLGVVARPNVVSVRTLSLDVSTALEKIVHTAIAPKPSARYKSLSRLAYALDGYLASRRPNYDFTSAFANFVDTELAERMMLRKATVEALARKQVRVPPNVRRTSSLARRPARVPPKEAAPRTPAPRPMTPVEIDPSRAFIDAETPLDPRLFSDSALPALTDDLVPETGPLPKPPIAPLIRILFLGSLLVVVMTAALFELSEAGVSSFIATWRSLFGF